MLRDLTERLEVEQRKATVLALLEKTAGTDFLTGVANRRTLDTHIADSMAAARLSRRPLAIAMVDLDLFKTFNDTQGHQAGDAYLRDAVAMWRPVLRGESLLARYGGEEFTVVMRGARGWAAIEAITRWRDATPAPLTCSIGGAEWDGAEAPEALVHRADCGLYAAKGGGRNRVVMSHDVGDGEAVPLRAERISA